MKYNDFYPFLNMLKPLLNFQKFEFLSSFDVWLYSTINSCIPDEFKSFLIDFCLLDFIKPSNFGLIGFFVFKSWLKNDKVVFALNVLSFVTLLEKIFLQSGISSDNKVNFSLKKTFYNFNMKMGCENLFSSTLGVDGQKAITFLGIGFFRKIWMPLFLSIVASPISLFLLDKVRIKAVKNKEKITIKANTIKNYVLKNLHAVNTKVKPLENFINKCYDVFGCKRLY